MRRSPVLRHVAAGLTLLVAVGCARAASGPRGPVVSPTGIVYDPGIPPTETRYSQTAALYLRSDEPDRALELATEGIEADPANPVHYFLAGVAHARLGQHTQADELLAEAERIYPAYQLDIEPERLSAWAEAFNQGSEAYADGLDEEAIHAWRGATLMYQLRPEAHRNLAMLLSQEGRLDEAATVYADLLAGLEEVPATRILSEEELAERRADRLEAEARLADLFLMTNRFEEAEPLLRAQLARDPDDTEVRQNLASALVGQERWDEARSIYDGLLSERSLAETELHNLGVALFRAESPERAAEAFRRLVEARPTSRDAWFNYANALLAAEQWSTLVDVGDRLLWVDPLGENAGLLIARAHLESGDEQGALEQLHRIDGAPVHVENLFMQSRGRTTTLQGQIIGNEAEAGSPLQLRFIFYGEAGEARADTALAAPAEGESDAFEVSVGMRATAYRYEVVGASSPGG
ncbi:MAG: tetratricopeptide repeat protein [Gemmatimonadota bacterium]